MEALHRTYRTSSHRLFQFLDVLHFVPPCSHHDLVLQSSHRKLGDRAFSMAGPRAWNSLPIELKTIIDTSVFKRRLKTLLFTIAYPS